MYHFIQSLHIINKALRSCRVFRFACLKCYISFLAIFPIAAFASFEIFPIELDRQPLGSALKKVAAIARFQWSTQKPEYTEGEIVGPIKGYYTAPQIVDALLKGTGIEYRWVENVGLLITGKTIVKKSIHQKLDISPPMIEEITVVGSHIRGASSAAPVFRLSREEIQNSGQATTQDFINSLPQIFGGGAVEGAISPIKGEGAQFNIANANGINLHGIGFDSTLVLINGRRIAPVGFGNVVDISSIPLDAIKRIDVMTDGASAIYGSDAVSGVVNIVLRKFYEGVETQLGYGDVTTGSNESYKFSQTMGKHWPSGNALFNYSYQQRAKLGTEDRPFTRDATDPSDILGENTQHDAMLSLTQQLTESTDFYGDAFYSTRELKQNKAGFDGNNINSISVNQFTLAVGAGVDFVDSWRMDTSVLFSDTFTISKTIDASDGDKRTTVLDTWLLDTKVDGEAFQAWGGAAKLALGGQYRRESFAFEREAATLMDKDKTARNIAAVFTEIFIPLIGEDNNLPGLERLEFTLAGRHEEYSDFGSSTNPKAGILWSPVAGLNIRATYSTSFRAPLLFELNKLVVDQTSSTALQFPNSQAPGGVTPTLLIRGYNGELRPEKAVNWTFGADIAPVTWPNFSLSFTYFHIDFTDRIQSPLEGSDIASVITDPNFAPVIQHNPDMELLNYWRSQPNFTESEDFSLDEIEVLIDDRLRNIAAVRERGIDFFLDYALNTSAGKFTFRLGGAYLLTLESQATEAAPFIDILNTPYNPVDLKLRNSIRWKRNNLTTTAYINHVESYKDTRTGRKREIDSWTTVDLNFRYHFSRNDHSWVNGATVSLSINNLFNKEPPFVANALNYNFDATNANALGRRFSLDISKKW